MSDDDAAALSTQLQHRDIADSDRIAMGHALGKLEEDRGHFPQAFTAFSTANALQQRMTPWRLQPFEQFVEQALAASERLPSPIDPTLGREVIFIVGMPRSGSTLFEQILAAHPDVEGASELPDLGIVIQQESMRRGVPYPQWIADASAADWHRLGRDYLARSAHWRARKPRFSDKMPENWKHAGILRAMLPGATVIETRRDPLETAWSCFKQQFYSQPHFANTLGDLGAYLRGCERAMDAWRGRDPARIRLHRYEDLLADPEAGVRALLADCSLDFDPACLAFHAARRSVRTASAAQVRQPLRRDTARTAAYGALLDGLPGFDETGQRAEHAGPEMRAAGEQQIVTAFDEHHHRRRNARVGKQTAGRTGHGELVRFHRRRGAAASAEAMVPAPVHEQAGASGDGERFGAGHAVKRAQQGQFAGGVIRK